MTKTKMEQDLQKSVDESAKNYEKSVFGENTTFLWILYLRKLFVN